MKKSLYLIPLLLIGLSAAPFSLYKDRVDYLISKNPSAEFEDFAPSTHIVGFIEH